jgi:hypothetical protein
VATADIIFSMCGFSAGEPGWVGCRLMPNAAQEARKLREMNTLPWSHTIVSGTITGLAAACSSRSSILDSRANGSTDRDIASACVHPGRIGSGVSVRASNTLASTDFVVGRSTAAVTVRVATSIIPVSSTRPAVPSSSSASTSSGVESICINSPGAATLTALNGVFGRAACERRVLAEPVVCNPTVSLPSRR